MAEGGGDNIFVATFKALATKTGESVETLIEKARENAAQAAENRANDAEGSSSDHNFLIDQAKRILKKKD